MSLDPIDIQLFRPRGNDGCVKKTVFELTKLGVLAGWIISFPGALSAAAPDQRTIYDSWIADSQYKQATAARDKAAADRAQLNQPARDYGADRLQRQLEREAREEWQAGEERMRQQRARNEAIDRHNAQLQAQLEEGRRRYEAYKRGDPTALFEAAESDVRNGRVDDAIESYLRVRGPRANEAGWKAIALLERDTSLQGKRQTVEAKRQLAVAGDIRAAHDVGDFDANYGEFFNAAYFYAKAASAGDQQAQRAIVRLFSEEKLEVPPVPAPIFYEWCRSLSAQGDLPARLLYCRALCWGRDLPQDAAKALENLRKVTALDFDKLEVRDRPLWMQAANLAALILFSGRDVPEDKVAAAGMMKLAAQKGDAPAMFSLGLAYLKGQGVELDPAEAVRWFEESAQAGNIEAAEALVEVRLSMESPQYDVGQGISWLQKIAKRQPRAMLFYGQLLYSGDYGLDADQEEAKQLFENAQRSYPRDPQVLDFIGSAHLDGAYGFERKPAEGIRLLKLAGAQGNARSARRLEKVYAGGLGEIAPDPQEAAHWKKLADDAGFPPRA